MPQSPVNTSGDYVYHYQDKENTETVSDYILNVFTTLIIKRFRTDSTKFRIEYPFMHK